MRSACGIVLTAACFALSGCVIVANESRPVPTPTGEGLDPTVREIDAAAGLFSESNKEDVYLAIAARPNLTCEAQIHLAQAAFGLFSEAAKEKALLAIIRNPAMCPATQVWILDNLHNLFSESTKKRILDAFNARAAGHGPSVSGASVGAI